MSDHNVQLALEALTRMNLIVRAFEHAEKVLSVLANLEQVEHELDMALDAKRVEIDTATKEVVLARETAETLRTSSKNEREDAKAKIALMLHDAAKDAVLAKAASEAAADAAAADRVRLEAERDALAGEVMSVRATLANETERLAKIRAAISAAVGMTTEE